MNTYLKTTLIVVFAIFTIAVTYALYSFKKFKKNDHNLTANVSFDCQNWKTPGQSIKDYLAVSWMQTDPKLNFNYISTKPNLETIVAFDKTKNIGVYNQGSFYTDSNFSFHQMNNELQIKWQPSASSLDIIKNFSSSKKGVLVELGQSARGYGLVFHSETSKNFEYLCALTRLGPKCVSNQNSPTQLTHILNQLPKAKRAIKTYCSTISFKLSDLNTLRSIAKKSCGTNNFKENMNLNFICQYSEFNE